MSKRQFGSFRRKQTAAKFNAAEVKGALLKIGKGENIMYLDAAPVLPSKCP